MSNSCSGVTYPRGFTAAGLHCGIKSKTTDDLALLYSPDVCSAAGTFTTNTFRAAPVSLTSARLRNGRLQAVVINSGNANACTGERGLRDAKEMSRLTAGELGINQKLVGVCSTGVIGEPLPMDRIKTGIKEAASTLNRGGWERAARAIMTTDTVPKTAETSFKLGGLRVRMGGMAKGSGMICPHMATMLAFITTDASVDTKSLRVALKNAVDLSFNLLTVDGDMSTNDTVLMMASGHSKAPELSEGSEGWNAFSSSLQDITRDLARQIAADGEGATTLVEVRVEGAPEPSAARSIALSIANSSLVKTAVSGRDPNWGRILAAAGGVGVDFNPDLVDVFIGDTCVARGGERAEFPVSRARRALSTGEVTLTVNLNQGDFSTSILTCDLTREYININALYTT